MPPLSRSSLVCFLWGHGLGHTLNHEKDSLKTTGAVTHREGSHFPLLLHGYQTAWAGEVASWCFPNEI